MVKIGLSHLLRRSHRGDAELMIIDRGRTMQMIGGESGGNDVVVNAAADAGAEE